MRLQPHHKCTTCAFREEHESWCWHPLKMKHTDVAQPIADSLVELNRAWLKVDEDRMGYWAALSIRRTRDGCLLWKERT